MIPRFKPFLAGCSFAGLILASAGLGASEYEDPAAQPEMQQSDMRQPSTQQPESQQDLSGPAEDVQESVEVLEQLRQQSPELAQQIPQAKGVFIIPDYATASLLVGGSGGEGVLMTQQDGQWGNPGFYDIGNIDVGLQAGAAAGSIVMVLMSDKALEAFHEDTEFSLSAQAGLTIINWSADAAATGEEGDALVWSDTEGLLAEASVGVGGLSWDEEENAEYYGQENLTAQQVLNGEIQNPHENVLQTEFAQFTTGQGASGSEQPPSAVEPQDATGADDEGWMDPSEEEDWMDESEE